MSPKYRGEASGGDWVTGEDHRQWIHPWKSSVLSGYRAGGGVAHDLECPVFRLGEKRDMRWARVAPWLGPLLAQVTGGRQHGPC